MMSRSQERPTDNGYEWYQCNCCPYGYHIDLGFVQYCETIGQQVERTGSIKKRRDRRRQRQSMEVLLGLAPAIAPTSREPPLPPIRDAAAKSPRVQETLDDAVSDFEKTLQRSKNKLSNNLPDVTAVTENIRRIPSVSSMSSTSTSGSSMTILHSAGDGTGGRDFDTVSIESCGLSPAALHNIREQMALSLERTKELEERVHMLPCLQEQLAALKEENRRLKLKLQEEEQTKLNRLNSNYLCTYSRNRSNSFSNVDASVDNEKLKPPPPPPPRRDFGVMAGVLTRNVGVGHQAPHTRTVSTATSVPPVSPTSHYVDRWYTEKNNFLNGSNFQEGIYKVTSGTQTVPKELRHVSNQTLEKRKSVPNEKATSGTQTACKELRHVSNQTQETRVSKDNQSQTYEEKKILVDIGVNSRIDTTNVQAQTELNLKSVGSSEDTTDSILCNKCNVLKVSIGVGTIDTSKDIQTPQAISLAALSTKSKSFNLGEQKLNHQHIRTIGCQYSVNVSNKSSQSTVNTSTKQTQHEVIQANKLIQYENNSAAKCTDIEGLGPAMLHKSSECSETKPETYEIGCNTTGSASKENVDDTCAKCSREYEEVTRKEESPLPSRIPRPQIPTTPVENRKFKRQDTYTKIPATEKPASSGLSALELVTSKTSPDLTSSFERFKPKSNFHAVPPVVQDSGSETQLKNDKKPQPIVSENALCQPPSPRKKCVPSKEMQAAIKVLNDSLEKHPGRNVRGQLKNANAIIETEWFKISSVVTANPLDVEDYLDCYEDASSSVLEYIVNMVDASGNTAMHYAVSHGNFDVVSILLDSKVCDINKQNKAGYTSVMLVSLAEVSSPTHANVVRRLFSLADVNIRAKQHGQTALMLAVSHGRLDMVTLLLQAGADINIQDEDGSTALMCAAEHGHIDIVKLFLSQPDCDSSINDVDGSTALKVAMEAGHRHIGILLYAHQRNLHGTVSARSKKSKSASASPQAPSSPLLQRSGSRALSTNK